jgi:hypothetical protein
MFITISTTVCFKRHMFIARLYFLCNLMLMIPKTTVSAGWMMLESIPLIASPTVIITMLSPDVRETTRTLFSPALLATATLTDRMSR